MQKALVVAAIVAGFVASGCQAKKQTAGTVDPVALIKAGDAKACAHPEVLKTLASLIGTPKGGEDTAVPMTLSEIQKLTLPAINIDRITLGSVDASVNRLTCRAMSNIIADVGPRSERFERAIAYSVSPSASNDAEFVVETTDSVAADRINIAVVAGLMAGLDKARADEATRAKLESAMASAGATNKNISVIQPPSKDVGEGTSEARLSADYERCMQTGEAAQGVTAAMLDCASAELEKQDARLNRAYSTAMAARNEAQKATLRTAQRAWIKSRDTKCAEDLEGGTLDQVMESGCHMNMTALRATELEAMTPTR